MKDKDKQSEDCSIIDEFIGARTTSSNGSSPLTATGSVGCTILTEFIAQGGATKKEMQNVQLSSPSQGCEMISTFSDEGFDARTATTRGQTPPLNA